MIYTTKPEIFNPRFEIVSCFVEFQGEFLLLLRQDHKSEPNTYWVPAGKVWEFEDIREAIEREIFEETWLTNLDISYFDKVYVKYDNYDFIYHIFHSKLDKLPQITINPDEHKSYIWRSPELSLCENLIEDEDWCIKMFYWI
ncbi:MAG: hypothetical protein ACD_49C00067G0056 [uncultured bacterium (gcode 4)]|uniref:Nudix hydrolase domain-containing protein n=1 Tax=uncultured bacterium (gcode 4) TaxID=1234023 RepID=K2ADF7_9BACT|nr:MAG: hypothetical protein ACD_49C00067G0056 [uncultured bacterium (gcode 4)]